MFQFKSSEKEKKLVKLFGVIDQNDKIEREVNRTKNR